MWRLNLRRTEFNAIGKCDISLCVDDIILKPVSHVQTRGVLLDDKFPRNIMMEQRAARQLIICIDM